MAKRKSKKKFSAATLIVVVLVTAIVVFAGIRLIHKCDDCGKVFIGTGYKPNAVVDAASDQRIICKDCAEKQHAISGFFGGDIGEYRYGFFEGVK